MNHKTIYQFGFGTGRSDRPVAILAIWGIWNRITVNFLFFGFTQSDILAGDLQLT